MIIGITCSHEEGSRGFVAGCKISGTADVVVRSLAPGEKRDGVQVHS